MNHEIMMYGIAQKVRGRAITNHALPHPDLRSPRPLAAFRSSSASTVSPCPLNPAPTLVLVKATRSPLVPCVVRRGGRGVQVSDVALRRDAQHAHHAAAGLLSATATQQRTCTRLTQTPCLSADAALHGARPGAEAHVRHSNLKPSNLQLLE